jgi:hypothetical protein
VGLPQEEGLHSETFLEQCLYVPSLEGEMRAASNLMKVQLGIVLGCTKEVSCCLAQWFCEHYKMRCRAVMESLLKPSLNDF